MEKEREEYKISLKDKLKEDEGWRFTFWRYNERVILTEDTGYTSKYIGNIYENKELLNLFK